MQNAIVYKEPINFIYTKYWIYEIIIDYNKFYNKFEDLRREKEKRNVEINQYDFDFMEDIKFLKFIW